MNRYVIIKDMSAGNESVGEMWKETKTFEGTATLDEVMKWGMGSFFENKRTGEKYHSQKNIVITKPDEK